MNLIISGPQGSGKGTQAKLLSEKLGLFHMESGRMLREVAERNERIKKTLERGELIDDEETISLMDRYIKESEGNLDNVIFDGFPRTVVQYEKLKEWLSSKGNKINLAFFLEISEKETMRRLLARRTCAKCGSVFNLITNLPKGKVCDSCGGELVIRDDDNEKAIKKRLDLYLLKTKPLLNAYEKDEILFRIGGERPIDEIFDELVKIYKKMRPIVKNGNSN